MRDRLDQLGKILDEAAIMRSGLYPTDLSLEEEVGPIVARKNGLNGTHAKSPDQKIA